MKKAVQKMILNVQNVILLVVILMPKTNQVIIVIIQLLYLQSMFYLPDMMKIIIYIEFGHYAMKLVFFAQNLEQKKNMDALLVYQNIY